MNLITRLGLIVMLPVIMAFDLVLFVLSILALLFPLLMLVEDTEFPFTGYVIRKIAEDNKTRPPRLTRRERRLAFEREQLALQAQRVELLERENRALDVRNDRILA